MRERIQFLLVYFSFWVIYFISARLIFLGYHIEDTKLLTVQTVGGIFWYGIQMDLSMAGFLSVIPFGIVIFSNHIRKSKLENWIFSYTFFMVFIFTLLIVTDLQVYNTWGYRLDSTPFVYIKSTSDAWSSIKSSPLLQLFISWVLLMIIASYIVYRIITRNIDNWNHIENLPMIPVVILMTLGLIIPIRGGTQQNAIGQNSVYFSDNNFANIAAINAPWNFFSSIISNTLDKVNSYTFLPKEELEENIKSLFRSSESTNYLLKRNIEKPNILLIITEGIADKQINQTFDNQEVTPNFNKLIKEGIYFSNFYASSERIIKTLPSILSGYPSPPKGSILDSPTKSSKLPILSKDLEQNGYSTSFHYGGNLELANLKTYLYGGYFQKIISKNDFGQVESPTKWGVSDDVLYKKLSEDLAQSPQPFFSVALTLSGREPYKIPVEGHFQNKIEQSKILNAIYFSDEKLGEFIENAKKQAWWSNTLIVIMSSRGNSASRTNKITDDFKIPMLWLGGGIEAGGITIKKIFSQTDFISTLLHQLNIDASKYNFSKNIFDKQTNEWAYYTFSDGFGMIQPQSQLVFENVKEKLIFQEGKVSQQEINNGKAIEQRTYQDYLDK